jgi:hypothetical protein
MADRLSVSVAHISPTIFLCPSHRCGVSVSFGRGGVASLFVTPIHSIYIILFIPTIYLSSWRPAITSGFSFSPPALVFQA